MIMNFLKYLILIIQSLYTIHYLGLFILLFLSQIKNTMSKSQKEKMIANGICLNRYLPDFGMYELRVTWNK